MKIEDQVLSLEQVQELIDLGFDVEKYASMCWLAYTSDEKPYEKEYSLSILDEFCYESASLEPIPTMTIGDIIECLPEEIEENVLNIFAFGKTWSVGWEGIQYCGSNTLIDALFKTLKWGIKQKHIAL